MMAHYFTITTKKGSSDLKDLREAIRSVEPDFDNKSCDNIIYMIGRASIFMPKHSLRDAINANFIDVSSEDLQLFERISSVIDVHTRVGM